MDGRTTLSCQCDNLEEACKIIGIPWEGATTFYRLPGMPYPTALRCWQPVAITAG